MRTGLQVTDAATSYPVTVDEVATYVRTDAEAEGSHLTNILQLATEEAERYTGRAMLETQYRHVAPDWPRGPTEFASYPRYPRGPYTRALELPRCPLLSVESVKYYPADSDALTTLDPSNYLVVTTYEPGMIYLRENKDWPDLSERPDAVQVEFTAGYTQQSLSRIAKQAVLLLCRYYYAGGSPNERDEMADDLAKAHLLLDKLRVSGWSA